MAGETVINIAHVDALYVGASSDFAKAAADELSRGATPETLNNIDPQIPVDTPEAHVESVMMTMQEELDQIEANLDVDAIRAEQFVPVEERIKPYTRKQHLYKAMRTAAKLRRITGAVTTYQETSIEDEDAAENALETYSENFALSLKRACGACAFKGSCPLEGKPDNWLDAHPTSKGQVQSKRTQESIERFKQDLGTDPMAHCVPSRNRFHKDRQGRLAKREL